MLKAVSQHSGNKGNIIYIGHSLGTTLGLMYASEFPKEAKNTVKLFIHLSPSYKLANMKSPVKFLRPFLVQAKVSKLMVYELLLLVFLHCNLSK